ncbi:hypothetical protein DTR82_17595 [Salmonella enterica subsp. enterica serovar Javiana]|nr:hypothetical protein [Salmonella enterica subsp. enterica serovar Javiana]
MLKNCLPRGGCRRSALVALIASGAGVGEAWADDELDMSFIQGDLRRGEAVTQRLPGTKQQSGTVTARSDSPVILQVPATWRGPVEVVMEISGEA